MSGGGYDAPHIPPNYSRYDARRTSGPMSSNYDRPSHIPPRRRTPSPVGPPRRPYDSYVPSRSDVPFREPAPASNAPYRPNNYRPGEHSSTYRNRSPSPDSYGYSNPPRMPEPGIWDRGPVRRPTQEAPNPWPERKNPPSSPITSVSGKMSREDSNRLFEPSESWKQYHHDRPLRNHPSPPSDRYYDRRNRGNIELSPERNTRNDRAPAFIPGGDRYRPSPSNKRDSFSLGRSDYDSYRPQYGNWTPPFRRDSVNSVNSTGSNFRRDSDSVHARSSDRYDSPFTSRAVSRKPSPSTRPIKSPALPSRKTSVDTENDSWSFHPPPPRSEVPTRAPSRSSIASTHVSDRRSPVVPPVTALPVVSRTNSSVSDLAANLPVEKSSADGTANAIAEAKVAKNGSLGHTGKESSVTEESVPKSVSTITKQPATILPTISNDVHAASPNLNPPKIVPKIPEIIEKNVAVAPAKTLSNGAPDVPPPSKEPVTVVSSPPSPPSVAPNVPPPVSEPQNLLEIKQPQPSYTPSSVLSLSPMISPNDIHIPSPTHSPILTTPPPMDESLPVIEQPIPRLDEIPPFSDAKTKEDALRIVVMTRLLCDRQTKEERVGPVLAANLAISNPPEAHPIATPATLLEKLSFGQPLKDRARSFARTQPLLLQYFEQRNELLEDKVARLKEEYLDLQESWVAHCNALNEQQKSLASEHENQHGGRTTRRTTAITDAVRSDFEMEQIIASLGNDEATDPNHLSMKNVATIPDMISVTKGQVDYLFDDTSKFIDHPSEYYAPHTGIYDWTDEEKQTFLDKFAAYPKQFGIIADFIPHKTAAQCVDFYYLHKKQTIDFRKVVSLFAPNKRKRRGMGRKKGNGLLVDIAKHDMEVKGATATGSPSASTRTPRGRKPASTAAAEPKRTTSRRGAVQFEDTPNSTPTPEPEPRTRRRKGASNLTPSTSASAVASSATPVVPATPASTSTRTPRSVSATPLPSAPTPAPAPAPPPVRAPVPIQTPAPIVSPVPISATAPAPPVVQDRPVPPIAPTPEPPEPEMEARPVRRVKRTRKIKSAAIVSDDHSSPGLDGDKDLPPLGNEGPESSSRGKRDRGATQGNQWSEEDKNLFLSLLAQYGDDFKRIAASMPNKTTIQVSNFYKSNATTLDLRKVAARAPKRSPTPDHHEMWKELPFPGSGILSSVPGLKGMPMSSSAPPMASLAYSRDSAASQMASTSRPPSRNPYPGIQSPMPIGHPYSDPHRPTYSPPTRSTTYPYPTDHRGIYLTARPPDSNSNRPSGTSSPNQTRPPFPTTSYSTSSPSLSSNNRPGYVPPPATGPNAPSIVHSPTGMSPKPLPPVQPMQSYPAHQSDPAHRSSYLAYSQTTPPVGTYWGPTASFYNPDGTTSSYVADPRHMPVQPDGTRRDHGYTMYPVTGPPGTHPPGYPMVPRTGPPPPAHGTGRPYYYSGWPS